MNGKCMSGRRVRLEVKDEEGRGKKNEPNSYMQKIWTIADNPWMRRLGISHARLPMRVGP